MSQEPQFRSNSFEYDIDDLQALAREVQGTRLRWYRIGAFTLIGMVALTVLIDVSVIPENLDWAPEVLGFIAAILLLALSSSRMRGWLWLKVTRRTPFYSAQRFAVLPAALLAESEKGRSELLWTGVVEVRRVGDRVFLVMSKRLAYIVPRRAFDSDAEFEAFAAAALEHWEQKHRL